MKIILSLLLFLMGSFINAQTKSENLNVFIDCSTCDSDYIIENLKFINLVRDRSDADVHLIFSRTKTGSGGVENTIVSVGNNNFKGIRDTTKYFFDQTDSEDSKRDVLIFGIKATLLKYIMHTPLKDRLVYEINGKDHHEKELNDKWDYWVFRTSLSTTFSGEKTQDTFRLSGAVSASRVTEDWKLMFHLFGNYKEKNFDYEDVLIKDVNRFSKFKTAIIKSLDEHWSLGSWSYLQTSTYRNLKTGTGFAPGIEYNIFPYSEYNSRQFRIEYKVWLNYFDYIKPTIFFKTNELLFEQELSIAFELIRDWGNLVLFLKGSNYIHDFEKNAIQLYSSFSLNVVKGLSIDFGFNISAINDQLTLPQEDATIEEILLHQRELATQFEYSGSIGFSFNFGSIYNRIVNPRFGD